MAKRRHFRFIPPKHPIKKSPASAFILLDQFSVEDIKKWAAFKDQILKFHWDYYNDLAYQRSRLSNEIKKSLLEATQKTFKFSNWQRAVKYKYTLTPLSTVGSIMDPGGRFNIGDFNPAQFPPFHALYLSADKNTALQELLSQKIPPDQKNPKLDPLDFALMNQTSLTIVSVRGTLNSIINLKEPENLQSFVELIKGFDIPDALKETAHKIRLPEPDLIRTVPKLIDCLLTPNWREWPMQFDVPFSSQIFGQMVIEAGIEGILYPSKFSGKDCLTIFPQNFDSLSGSFIELEGELPSGVKMARIDAKTWNQNKI